MLSFTIARRPATSAEVAAAIASIDGAPGFYFGCDAGVPGLHPQQAVLFGAPALALDVFDDGTTVTALDAFGQALLRDSAMAGFVAACGRGDSRSPLQAMRAFLCAWNGAEDALLVGALKFAAHRLAGSSAGVREGSERLGVFYFAPTLLRRDAAGAWQRVAIGLAPDGETDARATSDSSTMTGQMSTDEPIEPRRTVADDFPPGAYADIVERAVHRLATTPLVSLTLSQSFRRAVAPASVAPAFDALRTANPAPATFFFNAGGGERVFGASPDLQLRVCGGEVEAFPVCGTVARGHGPLGEAASFRTLIDEEVDAASLAVCSDALRNDLAPLCEPGSLRLRDRRRPMALATVVHTVDRLSGRLRDGVDAWDAIVATAAPVMATGTPRALALAAIAELEAAPRGWYGGLVVQVAADGDALVGTILRAAAIAGGVAEVRTGGDLLADSDPEREEKESRVKAVSLWRALGLAVADDLQAEVADARGPRRQEVDPTALAVALIDAGDPFAAAMKDTLLGLGVDVDAAASTIVLIGSDEARCVARASRGGVVAIGDAAAHVLGQAGVAVRAIRPEHGRMVRCCSVEGAPWQAGRVFFAARYATVDVDGSGPGDAVEREGWTTWLRDEQGAPLIAAHALRRVVCMLIRPESLMSEEEARAALRAAIAFASDTAPPGNTPNRS